MATRTLSVELDTETYAYLKAYGKEKNCSEEEAAALVISTGRGRRLAQKTYADKKKKESGGAKRTRKAPVTKPAKAAKTVKAEKPAKSEKPAKKAVAAKAAKAPEKPAKKASAKKTVAAPAKSEKKSNLVALARKGRVGPARPAAAVAVEPDEADVLSEAAEG